LALTVLFCAGAALLAAGAWLAATRPADGGAARRPDVVLLVLDALRADRLGMQRNGQPLTPFMDALGKESQVFTNAIAQSSWTRPSMATLFTSLHMDAHQVYYDVSQKEAGKSSSDALPLQLETLAEVLKAGGYRTAGVQTNGNLTTPLGYAQGFDSYEYLSNAPAEQVTDAAIKAAGAMGDGAPRFLYVHYLDPHLPYTPPESYRTLLGWPLPISPEETATVNDFRPYFRDYYEFITGMQPATTFPQLSETGREAVRLLYDGEVRYNDDQVRRLVGDLRRKWPNALIIITADHGEHFWDHEYLGHVLSLYDTLTRVPLIVSAPGLAPGRTEKPVGLVDLMPSIAERAGITVQPWWQGRSIFGDIPEDRVLFSHTEGNSPRYNISLEMAQQGTLKLIVNHKRENADQMFDLAADPHELVNVIDQHPAEAEKLRKHITAHRLANTKARRGAQERVVLDAQTLEQQKNIGY
jgi:arylsulfatase A-like enzyme